MSSQSKAMLPFLKWAGGKRWLTPAMDKYLTSLRGRYFEPFLGSGAIFFSYLPSDAVLSDANSELIECYGAIKSNPDGVQAELLALEKFDPDECYYEVRDSKPSTASARAARFIYLNRTCWNGLYRVNLKGEFNVPRGTKSKIVLPTDNFSALSNALRGAEIINSDFETVISRAEEGDLIFADPPYTVAHNFNGFVKYNQNIFSWDDQKRLHSSLLSASEPDPKLS